MKIVITSLLFLLLQFSAYPAESFNNEKAEPADSLNISEPDSAVSPIINLREIVKGQFEAAQAGIIKSSFNEKPAAELIHEDIKKSEKVETAEPFFTTSSKYFTGGIISILAIFVFVFVLRKKIAEYLKQHSGNGLKKSIALIRSESPVFLRNKKLMLVRKKLTDSPDIININESGISGKAKNLNLAKGELILAAKLKSFHLSTLSKQESL